jgi:hypothetical protein
VRSLPAPLLVALLLACEGGPCGDRWCPYGHTCVSASGLPGSRLYCAQPRDGSGGCPTPEVAEGWDLDETDVAYTLGWFCWYGDQPVGAPCTSEADCADALVARCDSNTFTCQSAPCDPSCGGYCGLRDFCTPRCDAPGAAPCQRGLVCTFGACTGSWDCPDPTTGRVRWCDPGTLCVEGACVPLESAASLALDCDGDGLSDCPPGWRCGDTRCRP